MAFVALVITLVVAYGGIAAVTLSQLGAGSVLAIPGLITDNLPTVGLIQEPGGGPSQPHPGNGNGNGGSGPGSGQYIGTHHLVSAVTPVKLKPLPANAGANPNS